MQNKFRNIREIVEYSSVEHSIKTAFKIKHKDGKNVWYDDVTYIRLREEVEALGKFFIKKGFLGKRIAVIGKNSYNWMVVFLATLSIDNVIIPLDKGLLDYEIKEQLERAEADAVFYADNFKGVMSELDSIYRVCTDDDEFSQIIEEGKNIDGDEYSKITIDNEKMSVLLFTSGTTSKSKAVMLSQKNISSNIVALREWVKFQEDDVNASILPFHHAFGMVETLLFISLGICNVFCEGLRIANCLTEYHVSVLVGVPLIIEGMQAIVMKELKRRKMLKKFNLGLKLSNFLRIFGIDIRRKIFAEIHEKLGGKLRFIISGAAALKPETAKWFNDIGILLIQGYGLSETAPVVSAENNTHIRYGSIGFPLPGETVKIVDPDENGIGEIAVSGDNVMLGYYKDEEATKAVLKDGFFHTGDMGYIDKDGYLFITGRKKYVIVLENGKNVFPEELEQLVSSAPFIKECVVYNKKERGKDCLAAKIVYDNDMEKDIEKVREMTKEHISSVNQKLIRYKQIKDFELTDVEMVKTTTGKIKR